MPHPRSESEPSNNEESLFAEDVMPRHGSDQVQRYRNRRRSVDHANSTVLRTVIAAADSQIHHDESRLARPVSPEERRHRYQAAAETALAKIDKHTSDAVAASEDDGADSIQDLNERLRLGDTRIEVLQAITEAELQPDGNERSAARKSAIKMIVSRIELTEEQAERLFDYYSARPEIYRQVIEIEQAKAVLQHEPDRFQEYVELMKEDDQQGIDEFLAAISVSNQDFAARTKMLADHRTTVTAHIHQLHHAEVRIDAALGNSVSTSELSVGQQTALVEALDRIDQPVREAWSDLKFQIAADGLHANWLNTDLHVYLNEDGRHAVSLDGVSVLGGNGQAFFQAAVVAKAWVNDPNTLSPAARRLIAGLVDDLGPGFRQPTMDDVAAATTVLRMLELNHAEVREQLGVTASGSVNQQRCRLLKRQLAVVLDETGISPDWINRRTMAAITRSWDNDSDIATPAILSMNQLTALLDNEPPASKVA